MTQGMMLSSILMAIGAVLSICGFLYSMYKIAKRIDSAIGVDSEGRTLSQRMDKVEHQVWPNNGTSLADSVSRVELQNKEMRVELTLIKELMMVIVGNTAKPETTSIVKTPRARKKAS